MRSIGIPVLLVLTAGIAEAEKVVDPRPLPKKKTFVDPRVVGGQEAPEGRYPFAVSLVFSSGNHGCGGSLITPNIVLSAAHCSGKFGRVQINRHDRSDPSDTYEEFNIAREIVHPFYSADLNFQYDRMIVILDGESTADPIQINRDPAVPQDDSDVVIMGWGTTVARDPTDDSDPGSASPVLLEAALSVVANDVCEQSKDFFYSYQGKIGPDVLCAEFTGRDSCQGDSGGPLIQTSGGNDLLVGVVSWGYGCADPNFPGIYSRVSQDVEWIDSNVCAYSINPPSDFQCAPVPPPTPPSPTPSPQVPTFDPSTETVIVTVAILLDDFPNEIGWTLEQLGQTAEGVTLEEVLSVPAGAYLVPNSLAVLTVVVETGFYVFTIFDVIGDGLCCAYGEGNYQVSLGTVDVTDTEKVVFSGDGTFGNGEIHVFEATNGDPSSLPENAADKDPGDGPFITLEIQFDGYPTEISWFIQSNQRTDLVAWRQARYYGENFTQQLATETIALPAEDAEYTFILRDSFGDGLCCIGEPGFYKIFDRSGGLLANGDAAGLAEEIKQFTLTFAPGSPTPAPSPNFRQRPTPGMESPTIESQSIVQYGSSYCTADDPCSFCEGDCDSDDQCEGELVCHQRDSNDPAVGCSGGERDESRGDYCHLPNAPDMDPSIIRSGPDACSALSPCRLCEGDCDDNDGCEGNLVCFQRRSPMVPVPGCRGGEFDRSLQDYCVNESTGVSPTPGAPSEPPPPPSAVPPTSETISPSAAQPTSETTPPSAAQPTSETTPPSAAPTTNETSVEASSSNAMPSNPPTVPASVAAAPPIVVTQESKPSSSPTYVLLALLNGEPASAPSDKPSVLTPNRPSEEPSSLPSLSSIPSTAPTPSPTISMEPTYVPSIMPSESTFDVGPDASPSEMPLAEPVSLPSEIPSVAATDAPSQITSKKLTDPPTSVPISPPLPSEVPNQSKLPAGDGFQNMEAEISVFVRSSSLIDEPNVAVFESTTMKFLNDYLLIDSVAVTSVQLMSQKLEERSLQEQVAGLMVVLLVQAVWLVGDPTEPYPLEQNIERTVENNYEVYAMKLAEASSALHSGSTDDASSSPNGSPSSALIPICAVLGRTLMALTELNFF